MEKLFATKNIELLPMLHAELGERTLAFTDMLLQASLLFEIDGVCLAENNNTYEEVTIFATYQTPTSYHKYVLFVSDAVLGPLPIFRIVADAVEYIESCDVSTWVEDLKQIATAYETTGVDKDYAQNFELHNQKVKAAKAHSKR